MMADPLTVEMIDSVSDIWAGFTLMDRFGVPKENCSCLDDMKERLRLHYEQSQGQGKSVGAAQDLIRALKEEDEAKRSDLRELVHETMVSLRNLDDQVKGHLVHEGTVMDMEADLESHMLSLSSDECPILVVGETSSGKSSLLNLLLGQDLLPQSLLSCTSVMCKIRYGPVMKAKVTDAHGVVTDIALEGSESPLEKLTKYVFTREKREDGMESRSVEIFVPIELLKTGVYIIDSPGFGENPSMDTLLLDYISTNDIFAFIYVIKSDNAGGVQEDRLQRFLRFIVEQQKTRHVTNFDPRAAIFVCNRWDLVPEGERDPIRADTVTKLGRCWPDLHDNQVFCLSATNAMLQREAGYISQDFSDLLDGIQRLIPIGLKRKVHHSYRWLENLLARVLHHVTSYLVKTKFSAQELEARHEMTERRMRKVECESDVVMKRLDKMLEQHIRCVVEHLSDYLKCPDAKEQMMLWSMDDLPRVFDDDLWVDVESDIDLVIEKKLAQIMRDWDDKYKLFPKVQTTLLAGFKDEFLVLESQLSSIEHCIQCDDLSLSDKSDEDTTRYLCLTQNINTSESIYDFNLSIASKIVLGLTAPLWVPGLLVGAPIFMLWDFKKWRRQTMAQRTLQTYFDDPITFLRNRSSLVLGKVAEVDNIREYVTQQMEPARLVLDSMRRAVPKLVDSNRKLMGDIIHDKRNGKELQEKYSEYEIWIPILQEKLARYGNAHIRDYDFTEHDVEQLSDETGVFSKRHRHFGIWTDILPGRLVHDGKNHVISIKMYRKRISALHTLTEETHLRRTRHPNIALFHGTYERSKGVPGMLLEGKLVKARQELFGLGALSKTSNGRHVLMGRFRKLLEQVGMGLEYLHSRGLVHMELSLDTIMILKNNEIVKLTNLGESRKADLPDNMDSETSSFCYLPPEVLSGEHYKPRSDIYSLGLTAWELWNQKMAFKQQRTTPLRQFIQVAMTTKLDYDESNPFLTLINQCIVDDAEHRITSAHWVNEIRKLEISRKDEDDDD